MGEIPTEGMPPEPEETSKQEKAGVENNEKQERINRLKAILNEIEESDTEEHRRIHGFHPKNAISYLRKLNLGDAAFDLFRTMTESDIDSIIEAIDSSPQSAQKIAAIVSHDASKLAKALFRGNISIPESSESYRQILRDLGELSLGVYEDAGLYPAMAEELYKILGLPNKSDELQELDRKGKVRSSDDLNDYPITKKAVEIFREKARGYKLMSSEERKAVVERIKTMVNEMLQKELNQGT